MSKRPSNKEESTDFTWTQKYEDGKKYNKYVRVKVKYPLIDDRKASNIDYTSEDNKRYFQDTIPGEGVDYDNLSIRKPKTFMDSKYRFVNNAPNASNVPEGYYATESGIFPIDFIPFTQGPPSDHPNVITELSDPGDEVSSEFIVALNIKTETQNPKNNYIFSYNSSVGRFEWSIKPEFDNPTHPEVRFPNGATRKRTFKY